MFEGLTRQGRLAQRRKAFVAHALNLNRRHILSVFDTEDDELAAYYQQERGKVWLALVGLDGALHGTPEFIGDYGHAIEHMSAHMPRA